MPFAFLRLFKCASRSLVHPSPRRKTSSASYQIANTPTDAKLARSEGGQYGALTVSAFIFFFDRRLFLAAAMKPCDRLS